MKSYSKCITSFPSFPLYFFISYFYLFIFLYSIIFRNVRTLSFFLLNSRNYAELSELREILNEFENGYPPNPNPPYVGWCYNEMVLTVTRNGLSGRQI